MLTTITTTTTTTAATVVDASQGTVYGAIGVVILIMLLIARELLSSYGDEGEDGGGRAEEVEGDFMAINTKAKMVATNLSAAIYPLLFSFALIVFVKVMEVI